MKPFRRLLLLGLAIHLSTAVGTLRAQSPKLTYEVLSDWSWYNNMGWQAYRAGDYTTAAYRFSMAIDKIKPYQKTKLNLLIRSYYGMSRALHAQKRYADAEPLARWVVDVQKTNPSAKTDLMFDSLYTLAIIERELNRDSRAESLFAEALRLQEKAVGPNDPSLTNTLYDLALVEFKVEKYDRAELHLRRALMIFKGVGETWSPTYVDFLERYAKVLDQLNRGDEARTAEEAVAQLRAGFQTPRARPEADATEDRAALDGGPDSVKQAAP